MSSSTSLYSSQTYLSPSLPPLSQLLTDDGTNSTSTPTSTASADQPLLSTGSFYATHSPSTILTNTEPTMASVDFLTPPVSLPSTTTTTTTTTSCMLTTTPLMTTPISSIQDSTNLYINNSTTTGDMNTAAAAAAAATMIYDPSTMMTPTTACLPKPSSTVPSSLDDTTDLISAYYRTTTNSSSFDTFGRERQDSVGSASSDKIYSFVAIPGMNQKKRPRRRYDEIERLYHCTFSGCKKSYGTLNHLNSHILMQNHGPKRHPAEFKEMRKEWRRQKKQREAQKKEVNQQIQQQQQQQEKEQVQQQALLQPSTLMASFQPGALTGSYSLQPMTLSGFY